MLRKAVCSLNTRRKETQACCSTSATKRELPPAGGAADHRLLHVKTVAQSVPAGAISLSWTMP